MSARYFAIVSVLLLVCSQYVFSASVDLDHATFRANDSLAYVEVYASVQRSHLTYAETGDSLCASFQVRLEVSQDDAIVLADTFRAMDQVAAGDIPDKGQFFAHVFRFIMKPGTYALRALLFQDNEDLLDDAADTIRVNAYSDEQLGMSDIELGCRMSFTDQPSLLVKNGVELVPNPTRIYGTDLPLFYFYAEAYGLSFDSTVADSYTVYRRIYHAENGAEARPENKKSYPMTGNSVVLADGFPISTLRTGTYELELEVKGLRTGQSAKARKKFWTYRPDDFASGRALELNQEFQAKLLQSDPDILEIMNSDSALMLMKYVLTKDQSDRVERLTPQGKEEFLLDYWKEREKGDPGAANRYFARVAEANRRWDYLYRPGWRTDRGRVFILHGEPDLVDRNYAGAQLPDHELWQYDRLEGGVIFVFMDESGFGDLDLVHSTKRGEVYNPDWNRTGPRTGSGSREGWK